MLQYRLILRLLFGRQRQMLLTVFYKQLLYLQTQQLNWIEPFWLYKYIMKLTVRK